MRQHAETLDNRLAAHHAAISATSGQWLGQLESTLSEHGAHFETLAHESGQTLDSTLGAHHQAFDSTARNYLDKFDEESLGSHGARSKRSPRQRADARQHAERTPHKPSRVDEELRRQVRRLAQQPRRPLRNADAGERQGARQYVGRAPPSYRQYGEELRRQFDESLLRQPRRPLRNARPRECSGARQYAWRAPPIIESRRRAMSTVRRVARRSRRPLRRAGSAKASRSSTTSWRVTRAHWTSRVAAVSSVRSRPYRP